MGRMGRWPDRGLRMARGRGLLASLAWLAALAGARGASALGAGDAPAPAGGDACRAAWAVELSHPRVVRTAQNDSVWHFAPPSGGGDLSITVTPRDRSMDPNVELYAWTNQSCLMVTSARDYGGNLILLRNTTVKEPSGMNK